MKKIVLFLLIFTTLSGCQTYDYDRRGQSRFEPRAGRIESQLENLDLEEARIKEEREKLMMEEQDIVRRDRRRSPIAQPSEFYVGAGLGRSKVPHICDALDLTSCDDKDKSLKIFGGAKLYEHFNLEFSYIDFGDFGDVSGNAFSLAGVGVIPLPGGTFSLTAKAGLARWKMSAASSIDGIDLMYGVGGIARFTRQFALRGEWEKYTSGVVSILSVELLSISAMFFF